MAIGTIRTTITVSDPDRVRCGSSDPVTGDVELLFRPNVLDGQEPVTEFFGPIKVSITFYGRLKSKIRLNRGNSSSTYRYAAVKSPSRADCCALSHCQPFGWETLL